MVDAQTIGVLVTGTSVTVAAIYYMFTLRMNMRTQQLALKAQEQNLGTRQAQLLLGLSQTWSSEQWQENYAKMDSWKLDSVDDYYAIFKDPEKQSVHMSVFGSFETMGVLLHEDLIDIRILARMIGGFYRVMWEKWGPFIDESWKTMPNKRGWIEAKYFYDRLMEFAKQNPDYGI